MSIEPQSCNSRARLLPSRQVTLVIHRENEIKIGRWESDEKSG